MLKTKTLTQICQARPSSLSCVLFAQWCTKQHQRVKPQKKIKFFVTSADHERRHVFLDMCSAVWFAAGVGLSPIQGSSHKTENYVQIFSLPPHLCAGSWPQPTRAHTISQHYCLLSQNSLPHHHIPLRHSSIMFQALRIYTGVRIMDNGQDPGGAGGDGDHDTVMRVMNEASTGPCCVLLQVFNYHT